MKLCSMKCDLILEGIGGTAGVQSAEALSSDPEGVRGVISNASGPEYPGWSPSPTSQPSCRSRLRGSYRLIHINLRHSQQLSVFSIDL